MKWKVYNICICLPQTSAKLIQKIEQMPIHCARTIQFPSIFQMKDAMCMLIKGYPEGILPLSYKNELSFIKIGCE